MCRIYRKYSDSLTLYNTCSKTWTSAIYYLNSLPNNCWMSGKQRRSWWDVAFCGVSSGSTLFAQACLSKCIRKNTVYREEWCLFCFRPKQLDIANRFSEKENERLFFEILLIKAFFKRVKFVRCYTSFLSMLSYILNTDVIPNIVQRWKTLVCLCWGFTAQST